MTDWLTGYSNRKEIIIYHTNVSADLSYFPVLVNLVNDSGVGAHALNSGYDIRFTSYDGSSLLDYERERFIISGGVCNAVIWIKVSALSSSSDTVIYMYYGNPTAIDGSNANSVWDSNFKAIWHLGETGTGHAEDFKDSTSNANNSTNTTAQPSVVAGKFGGNAQSFTAASSTYINVGNKSNLAVTGETTIEMWVNPATLPTLDANQQCMFGHGTLLCFILLSYINGKIYSLMANNSSGWNSSYQTPVSALAIGTWAHIVTTYNPATGYVRIYVNGTLISNGIKLDGPARSVFSSSQIYLARRGDGGYYYDGTLDEVRLSNIIRSTAWILTEYNNQNSPSTFYTVGSEMTAYLRSADMTVSSPQESTSRLLLYLRTFNSSVTTPLESTSRISAYPRTANNSIPQIQEGDTRVLSLPRATNYSIQSLQETTARLISLPRVADIGVQLSQVEAERVLSSMRFTLMEIPEIDVKFILIIQRHLKGPLTVVIYQNIRTVAVFKNIRTVVIDP